MIGDNLKARVLVAQFYNEILALGHVGVGPEDVYVTKFVHNRRGWTALLRTVLPDDLIYRAEYNAVTKEITIQIQEGQQNGKQIPQEAGSRGGYAVRRVS